MHKKNIEKPELETISKKKTTLKNPSWKPFKKKQMREENYCFATRYLLWNA